MASFTPRVFNEILGDMISRLLATTPLTDVNFGSVWTTMLEAAAQEDDEQYFQMLEIIRGYSLDTTEGEDLDRRAFEYGLEREDAKTATTIVTIGDSAFTKVSTGVYSGLPGANAGSTSVRGDSSTGFPASGTIIVGRGTPNAETVAYSSITNNGNYVTFNLSGAFAYDHGTDETIILSQGGARVIPAGATVLVPASDISEQIDFTTDSTVTILDGEDELENVAVTASQPGTSANVPVGAISEFDSLPFSTATVRNPARVTNGADQEDDQQLRDRIKDHIQSLSRGTGKAIITSVIGVLSETENKRVVSASLIEPTSPADVVKLFIDDGTGFIPKFVSVGFEEVVAEATGGEKFLKISNVPIVKAFVETQNSAPWNLNTGDELFVEVGGEVETITFGSGDFAAPGAATAQEVLKRLNGSATLFECRVSSDGNKVRIFSRKNFDESIRVTGGSANAFLNFPTDTKFTTKLYRFRDNALKLLSKDGTTASLESGDAAGYNLSDIHNLCVVVDGRTNSPQTVWFQPADFANPVSVSANEVVTVVEEYLAGLNSLTSSNGTKFRLNSNILRSSESKIRVVENFSAVFNEESSVLVDRTSDVQSGVSNATIFGSDLDLLYLGHTTVKFPSIWVKLATPASGDVGLKFEYWNGSIWKTIGVNDGTNGFTQTGFILFGTPYDWAQTSVSGVGAYWVRLQRNQPVLATSPIESRIRVCSANEVFGFVEAEKAGADRDYTLNRFIGQIELESPLNAKDQVTLGSVDTRAFVVTAASAPYGLSGGEAFSIDVDGVPQSFSFVGGDFAFPGAATAVEVANKLNSALKGVVATAIETNTKVKIQTNKWNGGTIKVNTSASNSLLQFPTTLTDSLVPHVPALESGNAEPYSFAANDSIIVVLDGNLANNFTTPLYKGGTLTAGAPTIITDSSLSGVFPLAADLASYQVELTSGAAQGQRRTISSYFPGTGALTLSSTLQVYEVSSVDFAGLSGADFDVNGVGLYWAASSAGPTTLHYFWYLVTDGAFTQTDPMVPTATGHQINILTADNAATIATKTQVVVDGLAEFGASVLTSVVTITNASYGNVPDIAVGTSGAAVAVTTQGSDTPAIGDTYQILPTTADQVVRFWNNKQITLLSTEAEIKTSSGGTKVQIASLESGESASVLVSGGTGNVVLGFPLTAKLGVDGYRYFTGLAQLTQWTVDGRDNDQENYPGIRAAGVQVEVAEPVTIPIRVELDVTTNAGISIASIANDIKSAVSAYINTLPVGGDVIISQILCNVKDVVGVFDVEILSPTANIAIADSELARINEADIIVG